MLSVLAGGLIAFSMPPWGWWPCAFVGVALFDRLIAHQPAKTRFVRGFLVGACWLFPATLWMLDLTLPGYPIQGLLFAGMYGLGAALVPAGRGRRLALPAMLVLVAFVRWNWPFGGVPLATLAMSQADAPLGQAARIFGSLTIVGLVGVAGVAVSAATERAWRTAGAGAIVLLVGVALAAVVPDGHVVGQVDIAIVQGGGPQNTRAANTSSRAVFERHIEASRSIEGPVDFVLWPENVVQSTGPLEGSTTYDEIVELAQELDAPIIAGIVESFRDQGFFLNASITVNPDGTTSSRYDKLRRVPFGEYVPFRSLVESVGADFLPATDAKAGTGPAIIETGSGRAAISISWEIFHDDRSYEGVNEGGQILLNPTNGSSYWLTIVQTQQIASSQLRAIETGRYVLQAAPTGFSAIIEPDGTVIDRSAVSETKVIQGTVDLRHGRTWAARFGWWPMVMVAGALMAGAHLVAARGAAGFERDAG